MSWPSSDAVTSCSRSSSASVRPLPLLPISSSHSGAVSSSSGAVSRRNRCSSAGRPVSTLSARKSQSGPRRRPTCGIAARRSAAGSRLVARLNSWRAAIHPPVRRSSSATSSGSSGRWYWSRNSRSTSQERNRRSSGPISSIRRPRRRPRRVERGPVPRQRHEMDRRRQVVDHRGDGPFAAGADDGVELVDDDEQPLVASVVAADEHGVDVGAGDRATRRARDGLAEVGGEHALVAVDGVGAVPHGVAAAALHEVAGGRRLAGTGRPDDHRQRHLPGAVEEAIDTVPDDRLHRRRFEPGPRKRTDSHSREAD